MDVELEIELDSSGTQNEQEQSYSQQPQTVHFLPVESECFLCDSTYFASPGSGLDDCRNRILSICRGFGIGEESEKNLLLKLSFTDPFCPSCSITASQLNGWMCQLDMVQESILRLKKIIGQSFLSTFSYEELRVPLNDEYIKRKLVEKYKGTQSVPYSEPAPAPVASDKQAQNQNELRLCYELPENYTINYSDLIHVQLPPPQSDVSHDPVPSPLAEEENQDLDKDFFDDMEIADSLEVTESVAEAENDTVVSKKKVRSVKRKRNPRSPRADSLQRNVKVVADPSGKCHLCSASFPSQLGLSRHIRRQHFGTDFKCRYCDKTFNCSSNRNRHELASHIVKTRDFICELCGKDYKTSYDLQDHRQQHHFGKKPKSCEHSPSECPHCGKVLVSRRCLTTHIRIHHRHSYIRRDCPTCGKPFKDPTSLRNHERSHLSKWEKALTDGVTLHYKCDRCPADQLGFNSKAALREHYSKEHKDERVPLPNIRKIETKPLKAVKQFTCLECPHKPSYTTSYALKQHVESGHGFRWKQEPARNLNKYPCEFCGKPCKDNYHARQHALTHIPKARTTLYPCTICNEEFSKIKEFRQHYAQYHPKHESPQIEPYNARKLPIVVRCPECPDHIGFTSMKIYKKHVKNGHGKNKKGVKSFLERGLPPPVRKKRSKKKKAKIEDEEEEMLEIKDEDEISVKDEPIATDFDPNGDVSTQEWIVPEEIPIIRSRRGRTINPSRNYVSSSTPPRHERVRLKVLRVVLPRCDL